MTDDSGLSRGPFLPKPGTKHEPALAGLRNGTPWEREYSDSTNGEKGWLLTFCDEQATCKLLVGTDGVNHSPEGDATDGDQAFDRKKILLMQNPTTNWLNPYWSTWRSRVKCYAKMGTFLSAAVHDFVHGKPPQVLQTNRGQCDALCFAWTHVDSQRLGNGERIEVTYALVAQTSSEKLVLLNVGKSLTVQYLTKAGTGELETFEASSLSY